MLVLAMLCLARAPDASASDISPGPRPRLGLEQRLLVEVLDSRGMTPCLDPQGKRIRRIHIVRQEVFTPADPFPDWLNVLHFTTRDSVVRREVLLGEGEVYEQGLVEESARNLRALLLFSVVLVVPTCTDRADEVDLLVFVKDLFSLRLEWNLQSTGFGIDLLQGALTERNIAGLGKQGRLRFGMDRGTWRIGESYLDPRILGSRWVLHELVDLIFPRSGGGPEGLLSQVAIVRPLATTATRWGGQVKASFERSTSRRFVGAELLHWDDPETAQQESLPWEYQRRVWSISGLLVRSLGSTLKTNISLGLGLQDLSYELPDSLPQEQLGRFSEWVRVPASEQASYVVTRLHHFANKHRVFRNLDSFALTEDRRMGHDLDLVLRWALPLLGFAEEWLELQATAGYRTLLWRGHLFEIFASARTRRDEGEWINNRLAMEVLNYSPLTRWGRVVYRFGMDAGWRDRHNTLVTLGGENSLRGYLAGSRVGLCALRHNLELRSRAWDLETIQVGWVLFWDGGDAFDRAEDLHFRHSVGSGLRILLPQSNRSVIRADFGIPLSGPESGPQGWFFVGFYQAFPDVLNQ